MINQVMKRWEYLKHTHQEVILLLSHGDFYEAYGTDAVCCADTLGISVSFNYDLCTKIARLPSIMIDSYLKKLISSGFRVAFFRDV